MENSPSPPWLIQTWNLPLHKSVKLFKQQNYLLQSVKKNHDCVFWNQTTVFSKELGTVNKKKRFSISASYIYSFNREILDSSLHYMATWKKRNINIFSSISTVPTWNKETTNTRSKYFLADYDWCPSLSWDTIILPDVIIKHVKISFSHLSVKTLLQKCTKTVFNEIVPCISMRWTWTIISFGTMEPITNLA